MSGKLLIGALAAMALLLNDRAMAQGGDEGIVVPEIVANATAIEPGGKLLLGVKFKVKDAWHIYWKNPGSSGLPTKVQWNLPKGLKAGGQMYPAPEVFELPGDQTSFGYEKEMLLITEVEADKSLKDGDQLEIKAKASWLMCNDRCIPGKKDVSLKIAVGKGQMANENLFTQTRKLVPKPGVPPETAVYKESIETGNKKKHTLTLGVPPSGMLAAEDRLPGIHRAFFFPENAKGFVIEPPKAKGDTKAVVVGGKPLKVYSGPVVLEWTSEPESPDSKDSAKMTGVLTYQVIGANGKPGLGELLDIKLAPGDTGKK